MNDQRFGLRSGPYGQPPGLGRNRSGAGTAWSVYDDDPCLEHLLLPSVRPPWWPTPNWYPKYELDGQNTWLERRNTIAVDCSTLTGARRWREVHSWTW